MTYLRQIARPTMTQPSVQLVPTQVLMFARSVKNATAPQNTTSKTLRMANAVKLAHRLNQPTCSVRSWYKMIASDLAPCIISRQAKSTVKGQIRRTIPSPIVLDRPRGAPFIRRRAAARPTTVPTSTSWTRCKGVLNLGAK
jgi:hypothetical protein